MATTRFSPHYLYYVLFPLIQRKKAQHHNTNGPIQDHMSVDDMYKILNPYIFVVIVTKEIRLICNINIDGFCAYQMYIAHFVFRTNLTSPYCLTFAL